MRYSDFIKNYCQKCKYFGTVNKHHVCKSHLAVEIAKELNFMDPSFGLGIYNIDTFVYTQEICTFTKIEQKN